MPDGRTGRLQARAEDTRRVILDTAVALYLSQGAENTTVSAIIKRARLGRTTFYRYSKDADDVLRHAVTRDFDAVMTDFVVPSLIVTAEDADVVVGCRRVLRRRGHPHLTEDS